MACGLYYFMAKEIIRNLRFGQKDCLIKCLQKGLDEGFKTYGKEPGNLGDDTDTVAAIAGGLAGLYDGYENIPQDWITVIKEREYVEEMCCRAQGSLEKTCDGRHIVYTTNTEILLDYNKPRLVDYRGYNHMHLKGSFHLPAADRQR